MIPISLSGRHSRAGGNPAKKYSPRSGRHDVALLRRKLLNHLDSRLRGNDVVLRLTDNLE
jgi:hypothetical protein